MYFLYRRVIVKIGFTFVRPFLCPAGPWLSHFNRCYIAFNGRADGNKPSRDVVEYFMPKDDPGQHAV